LKRAKQVPIRSKVTTAGDNLCRLCILALLATVAVLLRSAPSTYAGPPPSCDEALTLNSADPNDAASAIGICQGLTSAEWLLPDGDPLPVAGAIGHGLLDDFGANVLPHEGARLLALSTGAARTPADPGYAMQIDKGYQHGLPPAFPTTPNPSCPSLAPGAHDGIALQVTVQAPPTAGGLAFDWTYYSRDFAEWVCTQYADHAAVTLGGAHILYGPDALPAGSNIPMQVCTPIPIAPNSPCSQGTAELVGTGFDQPTLSDSGATGWQTTLAPVTGGSTLVLRFAIWDTYDAMADSTILLDNFRWFADSDADGVPDDSDNCPTVPNAAGQTADADGDLAGDACDAPGTGNVDCNGAVNSIDALKILRFNAALSVTQNEPCLDLGFPLTSGFAHGNVDCSPTTNSIDALKVLRAVAALPNAPQPKGCGPIIGP
jgi:hypothetical protein